MKKKLLSFAVALVMILPLAVAALPTSTAYTSGEYEYTLEGDNATIVAFSGDDTSFAGIPSTLDGHPVVAIGDGAFAGALRYSGGHFIDLVIPEGVVSIGAHAFEKASSIMSLVMADSVVSIGEYAFYDSELDYVTLGAGLKDIGAFAFGSTYTAELSISVDNPYYYSIDNGIYEKGTNKLVLGCFNTVIPTDGSVTEVGDYAFAGMDCLPDYEIPATITSIGYMAYFGNMFINLTIPAQVAHIGDGAFCSGLCDGTPFLESISVASGNTAFKVQNGCLIDIAENKVLTAVNNVTKTIPDGIVAVGDYAFYGLNEMTTLIIPASLAVIGNHAFDSCAALKKIKYAGSEEDMANIGVGVMDDDFSGVTFDWYYNSTAPYFDADESNWDIIPEWNAEAIANPVGSVSYNEKGEMILDSRDGWFRQASVVYGVKISLEQTGVVFSKEQYSNPSPNGYFGIFFTAKKPTTHSVGFLQRSYAPNFQSNETVGVMISGNVTVPENAFYNVMAYGTCGEVSFENEFYEYANSTITVGNIYTKGERKYVKIALNGENLYYMDGENKVEFEFDVTNVVGSAGKCYLVITNQGYGNSGGLVTVKSVNGSNAGYVDDKNDVASRAYILGGQYRTTGTAGIRFAAHMNKSEINGEVTVDGDGVATIGNITKFGMLLMPLDKLDGDACKLAFTKNGTVNGVKYLDIEAKKLYYNKDGYITFTAVLVNIPNADVGQTNYSRRYVAVAYAIYNDGSVVYSNPCVRSIEGIVAAADINY